MDLPKSPQGSRTVKITYAGKGKRKRLHTDTNPKPTDSNSDSSDVEYPPQYTEGTSSGSKLGSPAASNQSVKEKIRSDLKALTSSLSKPVNTSPKIATMKPPTSTIKGAHHRASSSISSLSVIASQCASSSKPTPESGSPKRSVSSGPEGMQVKVPRVRRTAEQRLEYLSAHEYCGKLEPHLIECTKCGKSIKLDDKTPYSLRQWLRHRKSCDKGDAPKDDDGTMEELDDASTVAPSIAPSEGSSRKTEAERLAILQADSRVEEVRPDEALCKKCQKWIRLSKKTRYALSNWNAHQLRCGDVVPSNRVAAAQSKLQIVNDSQAKSFTARSVECKLCGTNVRLNGEGDYNLTSWLEHKATPCASTPARDSRRTDLVLSTPSDHSPPSTSFSTDTTLVVDVARIIPGERGTKRPREEEDLNISVEDDSDLRPVNRPRSEKYVPVQKDAPNPWGWFVLPFKAFARGFRQSLGSTSGTPI